jgi:hypothetical protein
MHPRSWHAEDACLNAWPALSNVLHDGWVVRFADGLTRRANSANPLHREARISGDTLQYFENLFRLQDLPLIIRVPTLLDPSVDRDLARYGFEAQGESVVIYGEFGAVPTAPDPVCGSTSCPTRPGATASMPCRAAASSRPKPMMTSSPRSRCRRGSPR